MLESLNFKELVCSGGGRLGVRGDPVVERLPSFRGANVTVSLGGHRCLERYVHYAIIN